MGQKFLAAAAVATAFLSLAASGFSLHVAHRAGLDRAQSDGMLAELRAIHSALNKVEAMEKASAPAVKYNHVRLQVHLEPETPDASLSGFAVGLSDRPIKAFIEVRNGVTVGHERVIDFGTLPAPSTIWLFVMSPEGESLERVVSLSPDEETHIERVVCPKGSACGGVSLQVDWPLELHDRRVAALCICAHHARRFAGEMWIDRLAFTEGGMFPSAVLIFPDGTVQALEEHLSDKIINIKIASKDFTSSQMVALVSEYAIAVRNLWSDGHDITADRRWLAISELVDDSREKELQSAVFFGDRHEIYLKAIVLLDSTRKQNGETQYQLVTGNAAPIELSTETVRSSADQADAIYSRIRDNPTPVRVAIPDDLLARVREELNSLR